jgi:hypothetical protein
MAGVDGCKSHDVTEEGAVGGRVPAVYDYVRAKDHRRYPFSLGWIFYAAIVRFV